MSGIFEALLTEQQTTNELLRQLIANGVSLPNSDEGDSEEKSTTTKKSAAKKDTKKDAEKAKPKSTKDEVVAAVVAVKNALGVAEAKKVNKKFGLEKVGQAKEDQFDAIVAHCEELLSNAQTDDSDEEDDI